MDDALNIEPNYTAESYSDESELNDMKQHADKIIQGIKALNEKDANRAIWELFQNAVDLSENCEVTIRLANDKLVFEHNGAPFIPKTLDCLFKQVSSKTLEEQKTEYEENEPVGQYGTGFITTHSFGKVVEIDGALLKQGGYVPMNKFRLDRTSSNWKVLGRQLGDLKKAVLGLLEIDAVTGTNYPNTSFSYFTEFDRHKKNASDAIASLRLILPYVMTLNSRLKKVNVHYSDGKTVVFESKEKTKEGVLNRASIEVNNVPVEVFYLQSDDERITVILPFGKEKEVVDLDKVLPRLFLYYPLVGTQNFGFNYILHSRNFLPTEPRDGLYLKSTNEDNQEEEKANRQLIEKATDLIFNFIEEHSSEVINPVKLARINFRTDSEDDEQNEYFVQLKERWTNRFKQFPLVETLAGKKKPSEAVFLRQELIEKEASFDSVYTLASQFYPNIPQKDLVGEWTRNIDEWNILDITYIGFEELAAKIEEAGKLDVFESSDLKAVYQLMIDVGHADLFGKRRLLPNIKGDFRVLSGLNRSVELQDELIRIADVIRPDVPQRHIDPEFIFGLELEEFSRKSYITEINAGIDEVINEASLGRALSESFLEALIQLCSIVASEDSSSAPVKIVQKICAYYEKDFNPVVIKAPKEDDLDTRTAQKRLVRSFLNDLSNESTEWVAEQLVYIKDVLSVASHDSYKELFSNIPVYPNQLCELRLQSALYVDSNIPEDIKDMYDHVVKPNLDIRAELIHASFSHLLKTNKAKTISDLTGRVEDRFFGDPGMEINISENTYRPEIMQIIGYFKGDDEKARRYTKHYPRTYANKSKILVELADGDDTFSILSLPKEEISKLGALAQNPDELREVIRMGEDALETKRREDGDFKHKHTIGTHLERVLRKSLASVIPESEEAITKNVQNGQDIIIELNGDPLYYIEVKSHWAKNSPIRMSQNQTIKAFEEQNRYSLCSIDMVDYREPDRYNVEDIGKIRELIRFNNDIGERVEGLIDTLQKTEAADQIHLDGDFRTYIPQSYIDTGIDLTEFEQFLIQFIKDKNGNKNK